MKKLSSRLTVFLIVLSLLAGFTIAFAAPADYPDIKGHWAEAAMLRAAGDQLIDAAGGSLKPDAPMTNAEVLTVLCHVLAASRIADLTGISDISQSDAYYTVAAEAVALGLTAPAGGRLDLNTPATRSKAFTETAEAFQLISANPDTTVLSRFSDGNTLSGKNRLAISSLVAGGFIGGFNGSLHINSTVSRAEFMTLLYKILPNFNGSAVNTAAAAGGTVYSGNTVLSDMQFSGNICFDCSSSVIRLQNVTAPSVVVRSDTLSALSVTSSTIDRLVFASASGNLSFLPGPASVIKTTVVGSGSGTLTFGGTIPVLEVTGSGRDVVISGQVGTLLVSGSGNNITVMPGAAVQSAKIYGAENALTADGSIGECTIYGSKTAVAGAGTLRNLIDNSKDSRSDLQPAIVTANKDYGLNAVTIAITAPNQISPYETQKTYAAITAPAGSKPCRGAWYVNDLFVSQADVNVGTDSVALMDADILSAMALPAQSTISFVLGYINPDGTYQEIGTDKAVTISSPAALSAAETLALVQTGYKGDYTLEWTQTHDYSAAVKTEWINLKGYTSRTKYLVWVNIAHQRANIYTGSAGNWVLDRTFLIGSGASGDDTPVGVFRIIGRSATGWNSKTYTVKPVIFFINLAYGFHSRLYKPGTTVINDPRIGFPVSHGCIRMYDEDVAWFYKNIPTNTTVVVY